MLLSCWRSLVWLESALAMTAVFAVGLGPIILACPVLLIGIGLGEARLAFFSLLCITLAGPPAMWVKRQAEESLPFGPGFCRRVVEGVTRLSPGLRPLWALLWTAQFTLCVALGIQFHREFANAQQWFRTGPLYLVLLVAFQLGMTLAANLYLLLAASALWSDPEFIDRIDRQRFLIDVVVTAVILIVAHQ